MINLKLQNSIIEINKGTFEPLELLLNNLTNDKFETRQPYGKGLWYQGNENELYLKTHPNRTLVISRIAFKKKRSGIGTNVLNQLVKLAKENGFNSIVFESTLTREMNNFCRKHNFKKVEHQGSYLNGEFYGNYIKAI